MHRARLLTCALAMLSGAAASQTATVSNLEGLWVASSRNAPVRGTLLIVERNGALRADIAGFQLPVRIDGKAINLQLPDGKGDFRGVRQGKDIAGQWIQGMTAASGARFSTPVTLRADGPGRWRGEIAPLEDQMTYYLPVTRAADGKPTTYLRNPERNNGRFYLVSRLVMEGDAVRLIGTARGAKDESVLVSGQFDPDAGVMRLPINGTSFDFGRDKAPSSAFYPRGNPGERYRYQPPLALNDGWPVSSLAREGLDPAAIESFVQMLINLPMDGLSAHQVHSVLIARHGKLVLEEYFHGAHRDEPHDLRSASKSWTSMLIGAAMQSGVPIRLDTPVYRTFLGTVPADLDPRKQAMTLEHLVTMTAGFDCDDSGDRPGDEDVYQDQRKEPNWYRYMLNVPMAWSSGDKIVYCSGKPNLAAGMLEKLAGEPMQEMSQRLIAGPLRISNYHLFLQPTGQVYGGGGHRFTSRDFLKWAQLMNNDGVWEGRRIFSKDWARTSGAALRVLSPKTGQTYGYLWNSIAYDYQGRKVHAYFAGGNGGQISMGIPELDLAIVFTGGNYADQVLFRSQRVYVPDYILPAVR